MNKQQKKEPENFRELREAMEQFAVETNKLVERMDPGSVDQKFGMIMHQMNILGTGLMKCIQLLEKQHGELVIASSINPARN